MVITWEDHEVAELIRGTQGTEHTTGEIATRLKALYEANITEDIKSVIQDIEEGN